MPGTGTEFARRIAREGVRNYIADGNVDLSDPETNLAIGFYYLNYLNENLENKALAILSYNGGMGRVRRWVKQNAASPAPLPLDLFVESIDIRETREYVKRVMSSAAVYGYLYYHKAMEDVAREFFP